MTVSPAKDSGAQAPPPSSAHTNAYAQPIDNPLMLAFRSLSPADQSRLWHWLHIALWDPPPAPLRPAEILSNPAVRIYAEHWGREADVGVVAVVDGQDAGACWMRLVPDGQGLAYIDDATPQLGIALEPPFQRRGFGRPLMLAALDAARAHGHSQVSLTVHPENPAIRMYESCGFRKEGLRNNYHLMVARLAAAAAAEVVAGEEARWQSFFEDRARPCPIFVLAPDENLHGWINDGLVKPGRALDIGCGNARNSIFLARNGFTVDAVDVSASAVQWAREEIGKAGVPVAVHCESIFDFDVQEGGYELVYDSGCFHHIAPHLRPDYVQRVARALKPGGMFGLVCFTPEGGSGYSDEDVYSRKSLGWGLGYDEARLRQIWGERFDIEVFRRMREQPPGASLFGRDFLWAMRARKR
jgi:ribosomal protein S18 acetylase RimI-like enzyme